ncbi:MAG: 30S ribosomal protein S16 [Candidatus Omnitrophica bacterium]|nr:30S ribosomal protein S16 [Candidatus Omnitrophota bacterium]
MAVVIRLKRIGTTKRVVHRVVVTDSRSPRDGRFIEELGYYDPRKDPAVIKVDKERVKYWLDVGAKPSVVVKSLLKKVGV